MTAVLSDCRRYRYRLSRDVDMFGTKVIAFFGINPSTADANIDDQTVCKWIAFTKLNQGGGFIVGNVFAFRATDVSKLASAEDPVGPDNLCHLRSIIEEADLLVPCWGARDKVPKDLHKNIDDTLSLLVESGKPVYTFGFTASGDPRHPLMLPYDTQLVKLNEKNS